MGLGNLYEIFGLIATVTAAVVAYLRSGATPEQKRTNALLVAVLGTVLTVLVSVRFGVLPTIDKRLQTARHLDSHPEVAKMVETLEAALSQADATHEPLLDYILELRMEEMEGQLERISNSQFIVREKEMPDFSLRLIDSASSSFLATSYIQFSEWWDTPWGREYESRNLKKAAGDVKITRIFIFSSAEDVKAASDRLKRQSAGGIEVRTALAADLTVEIANDMVVVDGRLAGELYLTPDKGLKEAVFFTGQRDVGRVKRLIGQLIHQSSPFPSDD